jgi:[NiFe] hydrogenase assembly HybE family chaperone
MTEPAARTASQDGAAPSPDRPSPAGALEQRFNQIWLQQMHDVPMVNPALRVQAVGFRHWQQHWLGVLVTPWFMNLMLLPRQTADWPAIGLRQSRYCVFPAGVFEFIGGHDAVLGEYQACSLFSPMFEFADATAAHDTALATLVALFDGSHRLPADMPPGLPADAPARSPVAARPAPAAAPVAQASATTPELSAPRPAEAGRPPRGTRKVAEPHFLESKRDFLLGARRRADREP